MKFFSQYDRFDLEQDIIKLWDIADFIDEIVRLHLDAPEPLSEDELANKLLAAKELIDVRAQRLFDGLEMILKHKKWDMQSTIVFNTDLLTFKGKKK